MKEILSTPDNFNIYCTDADSVEHTLSSIPAEQLLRQIKVCSLLGEHVYISGGRIYENPETSRLLTGNPDILQSGIVAVGLRDDCRDFDDLLALRRSQAKRTTSNHVNLSKFLNANVFATMRWSPPVTQPRFKRFLLKSIEDTGSILRRRLRFIKKTAITNLQMELEDISPEDVTRTSLRQLAEKHIPKGRNVFMREVNLLYYLASSTVIPHLNQALFSDLSRGYIESLDRGRCPIPAEDLFSRLLKKMLLSAEMIEQMDTSALIAFREQYSQQISLFRRKWWSTVGFGKSSTYGSGTLEDLSKIESLIMDEICKEKRKIGKYNRVAKSISISSFAISLMSIPAEPVIAALSFLISCGASAAKSDTVKHSILKTHFVALTTYLKKYYDKNYT